MAREIPQYVSQLSMGSMPKVQYSLAGAEATIKASRELDVVARGMEAKASKIEELRAKTTLRENLYRMSNEAGTDVGTLKANIDGFKTGFIKGIKNPELAAQFEATYGAEALPFIDKVTDKYNRNLDTELETNAMASVKTATATMGAIIPNLRSPIPERKKAAQDALQGIFTDIAETATLKRSDGTYMFSPSQQVGMAADAQKEYLITLPPAQRLEALGMGGGGFESAISTVFENEGGYSARDGNTNDPVNFGINQGAHPDLDVKNLTKEQAAGIYKKDYWDAYKIGDLRPDQQGIVMDGVVNHWAGFKDKLVKAAQEGASPTELIDMRRKEYDRLVKSNPAKYASNKTSWENRLDKFEHLTIGDQLNYLPTSAKEQIREATLREIDQENKLRASDPAKWGMARGLSTDDIVAAQPNPQTASVLPKEAATQLAQTLKDSTSPDDIINVAAQLKQQYGQYTYNAVRDLTNAKMPDEYQAAINLAIQDPVGNHERIRLLYEAGKIGGKGIDEAYKVTAAGNPKDINERVISESSEALQAMSYEGYSLQDQTRNYNITSSIAKAYRIKNPSASEDDAVNFAISAETERFGMAKLNGIKYRVPNFVNGMKIDPSEVESRLEEHMKTMEFQTDGVDNDIAKNISKNLRDIAIPFLNAKQDGIRFRSPSGEVLLGKDGAIAEMKFGDIIALPTPDETQAKTTEEMIRQKYERGL